MFFRKAAIFIAFGTAMLMVPNTSADNDLNHCEEGWKKYDQHCYKLVEVSLNWRDASASCKSMGGYLASIQSKAQNDFLEVFFKETGRTHWWIGLHDHETDGTFVWDDGSDYDYTNWRPEEPYGDYFSGDCAVDGFIPSNYGQWYILPCSRNIFYLCQKKVHMVPDTIAEKDLYRCEDGWIKYDQLCFKLKAPTLNWRDASENCKGNGGYLASILSKEQNEFFRVFSNETGVNYWWIGLHDHEIDRIFLWDDASDVHYTNWRPQEPYGDYYSAGNCVAQSFSSTRPGEWYVLPCSRLLSFICQKKGIATPSITSTEMDDRNSKFNDLIATPAITSTEMDDRSKTTTFHMFTETEYETETMTSHMYTETEYGTETFETTSAEVKYTTEQFETTSAEVEYTTEPFKTTSAKVEYTTKIIKIKCTELEYRTEIFDITSAGVEHTTEETDKISSTELEYRTDETTKITNKHVDATTHGTIIITNMHVDTTTDDTTKITNTRVNATTGETTKITNMHVNTTTEEKTIIANTHVDDTTVPTNINATSEKYHRTSSISVTTLIITLIIVIMCMALMGGIFYYKRHWLKEKRLKAIVFFRRTDQVTEPCMECIIEEKGTR